MSLLPSLFLLIDSLLLVTLLFASFSFNYLYIYNSSYIPHFGFGGFLDNTFASTLRSQSNLVKHQVM